MKPDSLSAESAFPPPPPLLPPPVPPPVLLPSVNKEGATSHSLWRWNDRLALVVGGLTLFLLGIVTGRVFGPDTASDSNGGDPVAAVSTSPEPEVLAGEVNPPKLIVREPAEPTANPEISSPAAEATAVVASEPTETTSSPQTDPTTTASSPPIAEALPATSPPPAATPQTFPVSLESKVLTIKPLAATQVCAPEKTFKDRKLNTALTWAESVQEASQQAEEEEKLVCLIHVSGNFEMPGFT